MKALVLKQKRSSGLSTELDLINCSLKNQVGDAEKLGGKLSEDEKSKILTAVDAAIEWLDSNPDAETEEYKDKKKEVEDVVTPIITKLYQQAGAPPPDTEKDEL